MSDLEEIKMGPSSSRIKVWFKALVYSKTVSISIITDKIVVSIDKRFLFFSPIKASKRINKRGKNRYK